MKVLLIGDYPPPHGGVAVHLRQLHRFLLDQGVESRVLDIGKGGRPAPNVLPVRAPRQLATELAKHASAGWTIHLHTSGNNRKSWLLAGTVAAIAKALGAPTVLTVHSGLAPSFLEGSALHRALARSAVAGPFGFDQVVAVSAPVARSLTACGASAGRLSVHPAFLASAVVPGPPPAGLAEARARRAPLIAMAHHPSPVYGVRLMLDALWAAGHRLPDLGLALFGPGTDSAPLQASIERAGVGAMVERFGELEHGEALALIAQCDAFVRPTLADGDSISVREALALGVPCVASDVCVRPPGTFTFHSGSAPHLVTALVEALNAPPPSVRSPDAGPVLLELYRTLVATPVSTRRIHATSPGA